MYLTGRLLSGNTLLQSVRKLSIAVVAVAGFAAGSLLGVPAQARPATDATVPFAQLPPQAQVTFQRVLSGAPFPYSKDGIVFRNRERRLPMKTAAYYREYTVSTPGAKDRGARRIVCGGQPPTPPDACFYTDDHYANFRRIVQ